ncbi:hypothetical protein FS837_012052 [Tulasnella sp. UAMH 9824]|nr:hypothetical protein FS837_012052 [Tulasnella sp. UAMH 9824]
MKDLKRITQHHALRLKAFLLMPLAENQRESYAGLAEEIPMAKELFQGQMPKLELLKIPYWLKWDEIAYPKLKQLHIKYCAGDLPSVENLIRMMSACPMLESLSISAPVHDRNSGFLSVPNLNLAHLQIIRIENFEYLALASLLLRLHLPVVKTVGIALDEPLQDNATMGVFMTAMKPVIQRMSDLAETISVGLDQKDGVQLAFYTSTTHTSIKLSNFRWTGVMKAAMSASKAFLERTKYLKVTGGGGVRLSSTGTELVELVTSLRFLNEMTLDGSPNSAELLSMLLNAGNRDVQPLKGAALWQHLMAIELEGCLCDEMDDLLLILEEWKDRRKKKLQKCLPHISIRPGGCGFCGYLRRALERLVEEGEQCSEAESDDEAEGQ